jgi:hypothetical protein
MLNVRLTKNFNRNARNRVSFLRFLGLGSLLLLGVSCATSPKTTTHMVISVPDQRLVLLDKGVPVKSYPVSTAWKGVGDRPGSDCTPVGRMRVYAKIGDNARPGTVFKGRRPTGEIVKPDSPGRDPIVSRILWLEGTQKCNANAKNRYIYIHGTAAERDIGRPASWGCIRMKSKDVIDLYKRIARGATVDVKTSHLATREIPGGDRAMITAAKRREDRREPDPTVGDPSSEIMAAASPSSRKPLGVDSRQGPRVVSRKME